MPSNLGLAIGSAVASIVAILLDAPDLVIGGCIGAFLLAGFLALGDVTDEPFDVDVGESSD